jgi:hypothetical protein
MQRNGTEFFSLAQPQNAELGLTNAGCICQHGLEHWFQFTG